MAPTAPTLALGDEVAETYVVERLVGHGGMGSVYAARHKRLPDKRVAIKVLHRDQTDAETILRFRREAEIVAKLGHPNIVEVLDYNQLADGTPYLVLELLAGMSLRERLLQGPVPWDDAVDLVRQVGSALAAAHRIGVIHRDLKPENIFLTKSPYDGATVAKVLDFGISKLMGSTTLQTQESVVLGTPQYMSPEQARGHNADVDARTDVFALAAIAYELITGRPPFAADTAHGVVFQVVYEDPTRFADALPALPASVEAAVFRGLAKRKEDRFPSISAFVAALADDPIDPGHSTPGLIAMRATAEPAPSASIIQAREQATVAHRPSARRDLSAAPSDAATQPPGRWVWAVVGLTLIAGAAVAVRLWRSAADAPTAVTTLDAPRLDAPPTPDAAPPTVDAAPPTIDAAPLPPDAGIRDSKTGKTGQALTSTSPATPAKRQPEDPASTMTDAEGLALIADIKNALRAGKYADATRWANSLRRSYDKSIGRFWREVAACASDDLSVVASAAARRECARYK